MISKEQALQELQKCLKSLNPSLDEQVIKIYAKKSINYILEFCNRDDLDDTLIDIACDISIGLLKADGYIKTKEKVASISRGDSSITYVKNQSEELSSLIFKDFNSRLIRHKKLKLPKWSKVRRDRWEKLIF